MFRRSGEFRSVGSLKSLAQGFLVATGLVWLFNVATLIRGGDAWLGLAYLLILLIPTTSIIMLKLKNTSQNTVFGMAKWRNLLFAFQGVALGFWMFDLATTFYAINITGLAIELNPLGWPLGILGALAFYGPVLVFSYTLLYRLKENYCVYAAVPLTIVTLWMASMNLLAGAQNFQVFVDTAALAGSARVGLLSLLVSLNLAIPLTLKRMISAPKPQMDIKSA
jgi:hypothetical protein